ncbi:MAG: PAS domain-containing protein [Bacteroidetes bacterium]|nr:PAS domain-containing protein [Bacteroidota bacterium]
MKLSSFNKLSLSKQFLLISMGTIALILVGVSIYMINTSIHSKINQMEVMANGRSASVIEKIDRNFYERFGDVQAFAFNQLAIEMSTTKTVSEESQQFINTMVSYYVLYDLMMVCDLSGNVVAANTIDKEGKIVRTAFLTGKNFSNEDWFRACVSGGGPKGGAWYSDFMENKDVAAIYGRPGYGMAFAAPIKNSNGETTGVWYNFANWGDVTVGIRKETETAIQQTQPGAFILITNAGDLVIDSDDEKMLLNTNVSINGMNNGATFEFQGKQINIDDYVVGDKKGTGAYIYQGKDWNAVTLIPRTKFTFGYLLENLSIFLSVILLLLLTIAYLFYKVASAVSQNIHNLKSDIESLSHGELVEVAETNMQNEIGEMTTAIKSLVQRMSDSAHFAKQIGEGQLSTNYVALSEKDVLGQALVTMRNNLQRIKEEEDRRIWATEGFAKFGEILRNQSDLLKLGDDIIIHLVKYMKANQGGLFLLNTEDKVNPHLSLIACYAYDRKKFIEKRVNVGEGVIGQCVLEKETIYLLDIPKDYIQITSGLGDAPPSSVLIVPLKINDEIHGVVEIASFHKFEKHEIEFLEKLTENIASAISSVRINERTKVLLLASQQQTEELRAQEEEVRQNMEEMQATQEEVERKAQELSKQTAEMAGLLEGINSTMATIEFTPNGTVITANQNFLQTMQYSLSDIKGKHHSMFVPEEIQQSKEYKTFWSKLASGEPNMDVFKRVDAQGNMVWLNAIYNPIKNENGEVVKVVKFATDITAQQEMLSENKGLMEGIDTTMATIEFKTDGTIVTANPNFLKTMKYDLASIKGKHHKLFVPKDMINTSAYDKFWVDLVAGKPNTGVFQRITSSGETVWLNAIYNPIKNANGKVIKVIKFATVTTGAVENAKLVVA